MYYILGCLLLLSWRTELGSAFHFLGKKRVLDCPKPCHVVVRKHDTLGFPSSATRVHKIAALPWSLIPDSRID